MEWIADFAPVVAAHHQPTAWPAVLVLDSLTFWWTSSGDWPKTQLYSVLAAYGYDEDGRNGRLWRLEAFPNLNAGAWQSFFGSLIGTPTSIVADEDAAIKLAIIQHWGEDVWLDSYHSCEYHLHTNGMAILNRVPDSTHLRTLWRTALQSPDGWAAFEAAVNVRPGNLLIKNWVSQHGDQVRRQSIRREQIPPVFSNGALEASLASIRDNLGPRSFAYRNRTRMNLLLELTRLGMTRADNLIDYAAAIRAHLELHHGRPRRTYREVYDPRLDAAGKPARNSLWSDKAIHRLHSGELRGELSGY
ncbi:MAG: hypothetical protein ABI130_01455 [Leifsonia sp.]